jgi:hypothetical protein
VTPAEQAAHHAHRKETLKSASNEGRSTAVSIEGKSGQAGHSIEGGGSSGQVGYSIDRYTKEAAKKTGASLASKVARLAPEPLIRQFF